MKHKPEQYYIELCRGTAAMLNAAADRAYTSDSVNWWIVGELEKIQGRIESLVVAPFDKAENEL